MICIMSKDIDLGGYIEIDNLAKAHPSDSVCHIDKANFALLKSDETLYLSGHGSPHALEKLDAGKLAKLLVEKGLTGQVKFKKIKLLSCGGGKRLPGHTPFCKQLADELPKAGGPATLVIGFDGDTVVIDEQGKSWAKDTRQMNYEGWDEFDKEYGSKMDAWDKYAKSLPHNDEVEIRKHATELAGLSKDAFAWLYKANEKYVKKGPQGQKDPAAKVRGVSGQA